MGPPDVPGVEDRTSGNFRGLHWFPELNQGDKSTLKLVLSTGTPQNAERCEELGTQTPSCPQTGERWLVSEGPGPAPPPNSLLLKDSKLPGVAN